MNTTYQLQSKEQAVRVGQIIAGAMIAGVTTFLVVVLFISRNTQPDDEPFMAYLAAGFAALMTMMHFVVPSASAKAAVGKFNSDELSSLDEDGRFLKFYPAFQTRMIIAMALLEGAAFFNLVAFIIEKQTWTLGVVGALLFLMVFQFPTPSKVGHWVEDQTRLVDLG